MQKPFLLLCIISFFCSLSANISLLDNSFIAGNIREAYINNEYGKVSAKEAKNVPRSAGLAADKKAFFCSLSYTLWTAYQTGMNIAESNTKGLSPGNTIYPHSPLRSGLKVSCGRHLFYDNWEASIAYTWFYNPTILNSIGYIEGNTYYSPWISEDYENLLDIQNKFSNQFNRINSKLYKNLRISETFVYTPWIGLQGAWEDQDLDASMQIEKPGSSLIDFTMKNKQYWWCVGPYAGSSMTYCFLKNFAATSNLGIGINLCKHDVYLKQEELQNLAIHRWNIEPMAETSLGLAAQHNFGSVSCFIKALWEIEVWFDHNGFIPEISATGIYGDYSMQGLTITAGAVF